MTAEELQWTFFGKLGVIYQPPNSEPTEYSYIKEVVYKRHNQNGNIMVVCGIVDVKVPNSIVYVRYKYLSMICTSQEPPDTKFSIDPVLKEAFVNKYPVIAKMPSAEETEYSHIDELVIRLNEENEAELYCRFYSMIDLPPVPAEYVKVKEKTYEELHQD